MRFALEHGLEFDLLQDAIEVDPGDLVYLIEQCARFVGEVIAPLNVVGDQVGARFDPGSGRVRMPDGFASAFRRLTESGWLGLALPPAAGGGGLPWIAQAMVLELVSGANVAFAMAPLLTVNVIDVLLREAPSQVRDRYVPSLLAGTCSAAMCLSESSSGSDLSAISTTAKVDGDGDWRVSGTKVYVTYGEHDLTEDSIHLVLARTPGARPGLRGVSCFAVPRLLEGGETNDVHCEGIEHKLGLRASPTCTINYGASVGALGYLIGKEGGGLDVLLPLLNTSRILTGMEGLALGEQAMRAARAYAVERRQGRAPGAQGVTSPLADHPDVRRMLLTMQAQVDAMRMLCYTATLSIDVARGHPDAVTREAHAALLDLFAPIVKSWCTDLGCELASAAIQIHGGLGYMEDAGIAQLYRDVRATPLVEGANGVLAAELVRRRVTGGRSALHGLLADISEELSKRPDDTPEVRMVCDATRCLASNIEDAITWLLGRLEGGVAGQRDALAGSNAFLRLLGTFLGGWLMSRQARAASRMTDSAIGPSMLSSAVIYAQWELPRGQSMAREATTGALALFDGPVAMRAEV